MDAFLKARVAAITLLLPLVGCLQMEHDLQIKEDGSATYRLDYSITEQAITQFRAMFKLKDDLAVAAGEPPPGLEMHPLLAVFLDPDGPSLRKQLDAFASDGITLRTLQQGTRPAWRTMVLELHIDDLSRLADDLFFKEHGFDLTKDADGHYVWSRAAHCADIGSLPTALSERELEQITPLLAGFKTTVKVTLPGRILSTTAFRTSQQTAIWEFDFDRQPESIQTLQRQPFRVVFDAPRATLPTLQTQPAASPSPEQKEKTKEATY
ncbi:MAG TPA: hypothetical protein DCS43_07735 [Verrucomicrobia bacterium]|nr:hypothetical protein [Verrucomicrobiota bacterium]